MRPAEKPSHGPDFEAKRAVNAAFAALLLAPKNSSNPPLLARVL
jgi:hypothetical protein